MLCEDAATLTDDLTAWAATSGIDPGLTVVNEPGITTTLNSPIVYLRTSAKVSSSNFPTGAHTLSSRRAIL
ncbi:MAG: hypothetical protein CPDRYMAC_5660 [uncultured Paraburkholderia sp.]|nr:MAG: hypothetical protein CPDRYMAC_5660 [uncultured Paraburkholderia sp.]